MLLCLASVKGSPGVTTAALGLAARWPASWRRVLVEADPAGGDLAARYGLLLTPGLVSLAAAARRSTDPDLVWDHAQELPGGLPLVAGPTRSDQAHAALAAVCGADGHAGVLGGFTGREDVVAIVDCGRLDPDSPIPQVIEAADQLLLVARPRADELAHLAARAEQIAAGAAHTRLLLMGSGYPAAEVAREVGLAVLASVPNDPRTAAALAGHAASRPRARSPLARVAARIAAELAADPRRLSSTAATTPSSSGPAVGDDHDRTHATTRAGSRNGHRS
jgi:MinD-like ATPase involved in chromosome partitioning or flagellar assembly